MPLFLLFCQRFYDLSASDYELARYTTFYLVYFASYLRMWCMQHHIFHNHCIRKKSINLHNQYKYKYKLQKIVMLQESSLISLKSQSSNPSTKPARNLQCECPKSQLILGVKSTWCHRGKQHQHLSKPLFLSINKFSWYKYTTLGPFKFLTQSETPPHETSLKATWSRQISFPCSNDGKVQHEVAQRHA